MNPFSLPGNDGDHDRPLCPWSTEEHKNYYVDVDHMNDMFDRFKQHFNEPAAPLNQGRMIVVLGREGCGKSSLINRCVWWLSSNLGADIRTVTIDLRMTGKANVSKADRMKSAAQRTLHNVIVSKIVDDYYLDQIRDSVNDPGELYRTISDCLGANLALFLLLPPMTDARGEFLDYATSVSPRMFFFTESVYKDVLVADVREAREAEAPTPIVLEVGPLRPTDGTTFCTARIGNTVAGEFPRMRPTDMARTAIGGLSIRHLQNALFQVYEQRRRAGERYTRLDFVTYEELTESVYKSLLGSSEGWGPDEQW